MWFSTSLTIDYIFAYLGPMKPLALFLLLACYISTSNAQSAADTAATQIRQLLKPGKHLVHYFRTDVAKKDVDMYGEDTLEITATGDQLYFHGTGKTSGLDSVCFDLGQNMALFRHRQIPFMNISHVPATANAFHTPCVTYAYELNQNSMSDSTDINTIHMVRYDFGVSHLALIGKTMVIFMTATMNMQGGKPVVQPDVLTFLID
jgi:hypothetical protein